MKERIFRYNINDKLDVDEPFIEFIEDTIAPTCDERNYPRVKANFRIVIRIEEIKPLSKEKTKITFKPDRLPNFGNGKVCPLCSKEIIDFKDRLSLKEFYISGICQACQDKTFGGEDD